MSRSVLLPLLAVLILLAGFAQAWLRLEPQPPRADDRHYTAMAWNLAAHGVPSLAPPGTEAPAPTAFREPGYPLVLAALMTVVPATRAAAACDSLPEADCHAALRWAQALNILLVLAAAGCTALAVLRIGGGPAAALLALALLALSPKVMDYAEFLISESLALFLAAAAAALLLPAAAARAGRGLPAALAAGLACGALAATKQAFLPLVLPAALALACAAAWQARGGAGQGGTGRAGFARALLRRGAPRAALLALGWVAAVGPWLLWNMATLGSPVPSDRAREGEVLAYRVVLLEMTPAEYGLSWLWWTGSFGDNWVRDGFPEALWLRFQDHRPEGFTPTAHDRWAADVAARQAEGLTPGEAYAAVASDYRNRLLENWPRHLMISLSVLNRGLWVDGFALVTLPCLVVALLFARRWGQGLFYLFALPGLVGLAIHAGFSNNIPRWNLPLAPVLAAAAALVLGRLGSRLAGRIARRRRAAA